MKSSGKKHRESKGAMATYEVYFHAPIKGLAVMRIEAASEDELWEKFGRMVDACRKGMGL